MKKVDLSYLYILFSCLEFCSLKPSSACEYVHCYEIIAFELCVQYTCVCTHAFIHALT